MFKIFEGFDDINYQNIFSLSSTKLGVMISNYISLCKSIWMLGNISFLIE